MLIESHVNKLEEDILAFQEGEYFCRLAWIGKLTRMDGALMVCGIN